ncbi:hypothetical protein MUU72_24700 [Streptomyces sp. RS10V-4]|uniref:hypothetical protein n=1 Tax=Streptomyces rhizoryzae TaxID=2932493 RepID=UPI00200385C6|nr:hypothetical protein [Streptomyces rhizoryzae]MCK7626263.1 hypothetical protein [Streptomyces rhizoryzae]
MSTDNQAQATAELDGILPLDNHQPIIAPGVTPRVKKPGERDVVKPMDNHQPIAAPGVAITEDNHQPIGEPK